MQDVAANRTCAVGIGQRSPRAPPRGKPPETCHIFLGQHNGLDTSLPPPITAFRCTRMVLAMMLLCASSVTLFNGPEPTCVYRSFPAALDPRCILLKSPCMMSLSAVCMHRISLEAFDALNAPQMARMLACLGYFAGAALSRWSRPGCSQSRLPPFSRQLVLARLRSAVHPPCKRMKYECPSCALWR